MGSAIFVEFNTTIAEYDPAQGMDGKALARAMDALGDIAQSLGVQAPWDFYSESNKESFDKIGEELPEGMSEGEVRWFDSREGLKSVRALLTKLEAEPEIVEEGFRAMKDLKALESVLMLVEKHNAKFRLRIDI